MNSNFFIVLICCLGAFQGLILGIVLYQTKIKEHSHNQWLSSLLFLLSYGIIAEILHFFQLGFYDIWYFVFLDYDWLYGPLLYFIVLSTTSPNFRLKRNDLIHFTPLILEIIISIYVKSQTIFWDGTKESLSVFGYWSYVVWMHYPIKPIITGSLIIFYSFKANRILKLSGHINGYEIFKDRYKWILNLIRVLRNFAFFFIAFVITDMLFFNYAFRPINSPIFLGLAVITYWMGLEGFSRRKTIHFRKMTGLTADSINVHHLGTELEQYMKDQKAYLDPDLKLESIARELKVSPSDISKSIKINFNCNVREWINEYRYRHFLNQLENGTAKGENLLTLAFDAGFNSKASFNRVIKKMSGLTPKDLMKNTINNRF